MLLSMESSNKVVIPGFMWGKKYIPIKTQIPANSSPQTEEL